MLVSLIDQTKKICEQSLSQPDLLKVRAAVQSIGLDPTDCSRLVHSVTESPQSWEAVMTLKERVLATDLDSENAPLERFLLINGALDSLPKLLEAHLYNSVKEMLCAEFQSWADLDKAFNREIVGSSRFVGMCKVASLRRLIAGQFDWEVSGLPISYLMRVSPSSLPQAVYFAATKLKGLSPIFFAHLGYRRLGDSLREDEANKSYYRMAKSLELQPEVRGFVASSWIRSPDTHRVSPHLAWLNRVFLENGGFVAVRGPANPNGGVFVRSETRRRLYELGKFKPTIGLVLWARKEMLAWAAAHPELEDE